MSEQSYEDLITRPHHVSATRPRMSNHDRAAQFSPFAALTGYDAEIRETARLTSERQELDEASAARMDSCLQLLAEHAAERPTVSVTYFLPDARKKGGAYVTVTGDFRRLDESDATLVLTNGMKIPVADIYTLNGTVFQPLE